MRGGPSSEFEVSLQTGLNVLRSLPARFSGLDIFISPEGQWHMGGRVVSPERVLPHADVIFNALHGEYGEDGRIQRLLSDFGVPYTGSDALGSAIAMNKALAKKLLKNKLELKMPEDVAVGADEPVSESVEKIFRLMSPPYMVKPIALGSSVGIKKADTIPALAAALGEILERQKSALVEEFIFGREATCGVVEGLRGQEIYALPPVEISPPSDRPFFDYEAKYGGRSREVCPGCFDAGDKEEIQRLSSAVHGALGLRHYSRSDFIVSPKGIYFLEVNTLPGLTDESLFPKSLEAVGVSMPEFVEHVVELALRS